MPVVIRLARFGTKHKPVYRITVADSRRWLKGKFLEVIGYYNPQARGQELAIKLDLPKAKEWIQKGAQPTERVRSLMRKLETSN